MREHGSGVVRAASIAVWLLVGATAVEGQTDYYNTDRNRPVRIEDAHPTEQYALEIKLAPIKLERAEGGAYRWTIDPELAYGILPSTNVEVGFPIAIGDSPGEGSGLAGMEVSLFHNLNTETTSLPALALRGDLTLPVGAEGPDRVIPSATGIATRTFSFARVHLNASYTFADPGEGGEQEGHEESQWLAGIAVDRAIPLQAILLIADVYAQQPLEEAADVAWNAGAGVRYQVNPYLAVDLGLGRRFTEAPAWFVTFGSALHLGVRPLIPFRR